MRISVSSKEPWQVLHSIPVLQEDMRCFSKPSACAVRCVIWSIRNMKRSRNFRLLQNRSVCSGSSGFELFLIFPDCLLGKLLQIVRIRFGGKCEKQNHIGVTLCGC